MTYWHLPLCRNKSSCEMEMFSFHAKETNFHIKGFVRSVSIVKTVTLDLKMLFKTLVTVFHYTDRPKAGQSMNARIESRENWVPA